MADAPPPVPSLARAREQKISELSQYFANDDLTLDELERRIERVYRAGNVLELDEITADLRSVSQPAGSELAPARGSSVSAAPVSAPVGARMLAIMGETRRLGRWQVPRQLDVLSIMSDTKLDLTQAVVAPGVTEIHVRAFWSACKIVVPPNMRVINEMHAIMASVTSKAHEMDAPGARSVGPVIRLTGTALMAEVKVVVRTVESVHDDDDDDDDD
ncbi:MAG TPA: LiaF domain-containing protein [Gemmatimonadaceae bacterium]